LSRRIEATVTVLWKTEDIGALVESRGDGPGVVQRFDRLLNLVPALVDRFVEGLLGAGGEGRMTL
jgi:hypothetical protein